MTAIRRGSITLVGPKERIRDQVAAWKEGGIKSLFVMGDRKAQEVMAEICL